MANGAAGSCRSTVRSRDCCVPLDLLTSGRIRLARETGLSLSMSGPGALNEKRQRYIVGNFIFGGRGLFWAFSELGLKLGLIGLVLGVWRSGGFRNRLLILRLCLFGGLVNWVCFE